MRRGGKPRRALRCVRVALEVSLIADLTVMLGVHPKLMDAQIAYHCPNLPANKNFQRNANATQSA
ncbi:MAG: hypothetical protein ACKN9T_10400, partial [Candidatus Methylumidiphilus sp.]